MSKPEPTAESAEQTPIPKPVSDFLLRYCRNPQAVDDLKAAAATAKAEGRREQRNETLKFAKKYRNNPADLYEDLIHELTIAALKGDTKPPKLDPSKGDSIRHGA